MGEFLELHRLFEAGGFLPKEPFPSREVRALEQCVLQNTFHTTESLNDISAVIVQIPQLTVVTLMGPPERVALDQPVLLEIRAAAPSFIIG
jgi:hypothetical protein